MAANDLHFLTADEFNDLEGKVLEVQRMLASLIQLYAESDFSWMVGASSQKLSPVTCCRGQLRARVKFEYRYK